MSIVGRFLCVVAIVCPLMAGLFIVHVHQDGVQLGYKLMKEEKRHRELVMTLKKLEVELAAECAPERLKELASRLGLNQPENSQIVGAVYPSGGPNGE
jgi:cell division protein FtsL